MLDWALPEFCKRVCKCKSTYIYLNVLLHTFFWGVFLLTYFNFFIPLTFKYWKHVFELWEDAGVPGEHCCVSEMFPHPLATGERGLCCCQLHRGWKWTSELDMRIQRRPELGTSSIRHHRLFCWFHLYWSRVYTPVEASPPVGEFFRCHISLWVRDEFEIVFRICTSTVVNTFNDTRQMRHW